MGVRLAIGGEELCADAIRGVQAKRNVYIFICGAIDMWECVYELQPCDN